MKKVLIAGGSSVANVIHSYLLMDSRYEVLGCLVDDQFICDTKMPVPVYSISKMLDKFSPNEYSIILAIGYGNLNRTRESLFKRIKALGYTFETYIHPHAYVHSKLIGEGAIIMPGAVVEPGAVIGASAVIWSNSTIAHDAYIYENCWIAAGTVVSGGAKVLKNSFIGVNSSIVNDVVVNEFNFIGANSLIVKCTSGYEVHLSRSAEFFRCNSDDYIKYFGK